MTKILSMNEMALYTLSEGKYFEGPENYNPGEEYIDIAKKELSHWTIFKSGIFYQCNPEKEVILPKFGWKIHISSTSSNAKTILSLAIKVCKENNVPFKFLLDSKLRDMSSDKIWSRGGADKFITIYPTTETNFIYLINELYKILHKYDGPYILSDKRYKDCNVLYYRFGSILPDKKVISDGREFHLLESPSGEIEFDQRQPYFNLPTWVEDPFKSNNEENNESNITLNKGRYNILNVLHFSVTGGVYLAEDTQSENIKVVIKEARPNTRTTYFSEKDSVDYLLAEYENINACKSRQSKHPNESHLYLSNLDKEV